MFNWIYHNRDMFLVNYTEIGMSHQFAIELENEHSQFANSAVVSYIETCLNTTYDTNIPLVLPPGQVVLGAGQVEILTSGMIFLVFTISHDKQEILIIFFLCLVSLKVK